MKLKEWIKELDESMDMTPHVFADGDNLNKAIRIIEHLLKAVQMQEFMSCTCSLKIWDPAIEACEKEIS